MGKHSAPQGRKQGRRAPAHARAAQPRGVVSHDAKRRAGMTRSGGGQRLHAPKSGRKRHVIATVLGVILLLAGVGLILYPAITATVAQGAADRALAAWRADQGVETQTIEDTPAADTGYRSKAGDATYEKLVEYNQEVAAGTGDAVNDPFAFSGDDLAALGLPDGIIGSITVERFGETMPLFLGATKQHMAVGAAVIAGTSMPIGGEGSRCVIAAHRGFNGGFTMFRDVETLVPGDLVRIETPWETLCYRMVGHQIISPNDTAALAPIPGKDLLTLLTCHPYGENYQRYLVLCERDTAAEEELAAERAQGSAGADDAGALLNRFSRAVWPGWSAGSPELNVEMALRAVGLLIAVLTGGYLVIRR